MNKVIELINNITVSIILKKRDKKSPVRSLSGQQDMIINKEKRAILF